jgi:hypothetical protein
MRSHSAPTFVLAVFWVALAAPPAGAADRPPSDKPLDPQAVAFFEQKIRPVLDAHCLQCHSALARGARKLKGGLYLDTRDGVRKGGASGPVLVPHKAADSLLIKALRYDDDVRMPPKGKLPDSVIADFEKWVNMGAPDPRQGPAGVGKPVGMSVEEGCRFWAYRPPKPPAIPAVKAADWPLDAIDRFVLAKLEAKGLKPAPEADRPTLARRLYYDLTGLPPTPEDVDAFAGDTDPRAYEKLVDRLLASPPFGERWGRHWLDIARYAESVTLRGLIFKEAWRYRDYVIDSFNRDVPFDRFVREQIAGDLLPAATPADRRRQLVATTFLALGNTNLEEQDKKQLRMDVVDEQLDVIGKGLLAQTVTCARCHDHKFDPIPTCDYYALAGILRNVKAMEHANVSRWVEVPLPADPGEEAELKRLRDAGPKRPMVMTVVEEQQIEDARVHVRGSVHNLGPAVPRGFLQVATPGPAPALPKGQSGRRELAEWIVSPENPLTARVIVNRAWHWLFGAGIVRTTDNFGTTGERPSHPELLDHLAVSFVADGWSVKKLIRRIVLSRTYRQSAAGDGSADPDNLLFGRANRRRLGAECIRDTMLHVSGQLSQRRGGPTFPASLSADYGYQAAAPCRSVYLPMFRNALPEILELFDAADPSLVTGRRNVSTTAPQALFLMNHPFPAEQARHAAVRLLGEKLADDDARVIRAYRLTLGRAPTAAEQQVAAKFLHGREPHEAWALLLHALFASADFRYVN